MNKARLIATVLSGGSVAAVPWYLSGGVAAANCIGAYNAVGVASLALSRVNLANPGTYDLVDLVDGNPPAWNGVAGWVFGGTGGIQKTGIVPADTQARSLLVAYTQTDFTASRSACGARATGQIRLTSTTADVTVFSNGGSYNHTRITTGVLVIAGSNAYLDGVDIGDITTGTYTTDTRDIWLGCYNYSGAVVNPFVGSIRQLAYYDKTLSPTEVAAISAAVPT